MKGKCRFCRTNDLDNTGAHIFTDALIRSALYIDGKIKRGDWEAIVGMSAESIEYVYFGNSVLPDKRAELLGAEQSDEDIDNTSHHVLINRNLVCYQCEKKFGPVENKFIEVVYDKLISNSEFDVDGNEYEYMKFNEHEYWLSFLMVLINAWRASVSKFMGIELNPIVEEPILKYLSKILVTTDIDSIISLAKQHYDDVKNLNVSFLYVEQQGGKLSENPIKFSQQGSTYAMHLNRLVLFLDVDNSKKIELPEYLDKLFDRILVKISNPNEFIIYKIDNEKRLEIINRNIAEVWDLFLKKIVNYINPFIRLHIGKELDSEDIAYLNTHLIGVAANENLIVGHELAVKGSIKAFPYLYRHFD